MNILYYTIGLPAGGKDFYFAQLFSKDDNVIHISSDKLRKELLGDINDQTQNSYIFNEMRKRTIKALEEGHDVYYNATNLSRKRRINFLKSLPECYKVAIVFSTPYEECVRRNAERKRSVPEEVLKRMYKSFEPPHYDEGFDSIEIIREGWKPETSLYEMMTINSECSHDNPHHSLSCGDHCKAAHQYIKNHMTEILEENYGNCEDYLILCEAAYYHDISKYKCKTFGDKKGESSNIAHYFNHENVSAYDYLVYGDNITRFKIEVANLIANHMVFYNELAINSRKKIYNKYFWRKLEWLNMADRMSH
jgi:predicted kinase